MAVIPHSIPPQAPWLVGGFPHLSMFGDQYGQSHCQNWPDGPSPAFWRAFMTRGGSAKSSKIRPDFSRETYGFGVIHHVRTPSCGYRQAKNPSITLVGMTSWFSKIELLPILIHILSMAFPWNQPSISLKSSIFKWLCSMKSTFSFSQIIHLHMAFPWNQPSIVGYPTSKGRPLSSSWLSFSSSFVASAGSGTSKAASVQGEKLGKIDG